MRSPRTAAAGTLLRTIAAVIACGGACGGARPPAPVAEARSAAPVAEARYPVPSQVGDLVIDDALLARFVEPVQRDAEAAVRARGDAAANDALFTLAILDALADRWPAAVAKLDRIRAVEQDAVKAAMTGLSIRVGAEARARDGTDDERYAAALEQVLATLPFDQVRGELAMLRAMGKTFTPEACRDLVTEAVGPTVRDGRVGFDEVQIIVFQRYAAVELSRVGARIDRILAARGIGLPEE